MQARKRWGKGNKSCTLHVTFSASVWGCMVATKDASYVLQSTLVKGNILAY